MLTVHEGVSLHMSVRVTYRFNDPSCILGDRLGGHIGFGMGSANRHIQAQDNHFSFRNTGYSRNVLA